LFPDDRFLKAFLLATVGFFKDGRRKTMLTSEERRCWRAKKDDVDERRKTIL